MSTNSRLSRVQSIARNGYGLFLAIFAVTLFTLTSLDCRADRRQKVLVLHSYHQGLEWTDSITKGIQSAFWQHQDEYEIYYEYLDTKRNTGKEYLDQMIKFLQAQNAHSLYEVVIIADNIALKLANEGLIHFPGNPPVVFCGINNFTKKLIANLEQVTGVIEKTDHRATIDLMRKLHPERSKIIVIIDRTPTGDAIREEFREIEEYYDKEIDFEFLREFTLEEIPAELKNVDNKSPIYITTFNRDRNNNFISYAEGIDLISNNTNAPIYGSWDFYLGKGIVGGRITSGYLQGQEAGKLALKILHGKPANSLPIVTDSPTQYMFDYNYLAKQGIERSSLPSNSVVINTPPSTRERYRGFFIGITLTSFSIAFFLWLKYRREHTTLEAKQKLAEELEKKVQNRTLELEKANKELQRLSNLDGLSEIYNRRHFDSTLEREIKRLQRTATPLSLLMCDIDNFKQYNDTYGHLAGDECIRSVANIIQQHCKRISDIAARYGGEEFAVILPNTHIKEATSIAESIRRAVELKKPLHATSPTRSVVTISIGVASITPDLDTKPSMLVRIADEALYESKHSGRNRVSTRSTSNPATR
jgi:diguanylate cyclase (GGDEF)-like protein